MYGETNLGANDDAVITFLKTPLNKPILDALKLHVYPEYAVQLQNQTSTVSDTPVEAPPINPPKTTGRKKS